MKNMQPAARLFSLFALLFVITIACTKDPQTAENTSTADVDHVKQDSIVNTDSAQAQIQENPALEDGFYSAFAIPKDKKKRDSAYSAFSEKYNERERYAILALNRVDSKHKWNADTLVVPAKIDTTLMLYSPFPKQVAVIKDVKKLVVFSYPIQAFAVYTNGNLEKWGPTSMGKKSAQTNRGLTFANWKKELSISSVKSEWKLPYNFNIWNTDGIGWHQYDLPGYPASHSCLRLLKNDAVYLYNYADTWILNPGGATTKAKGTAVYVFGDYPWGERRPWKNLLENPNANSITLEEMTKMLQPHVEKMLEEQSNREQVIATKESA